MEAKRENESLYALEGISCMAWIILLLSLCTAPLEQRLVGVTLDYHFSTILSAGAAFLLAAVSGERRRKKFETLTLQPL